MTFCGLNKQLSADLYPPPDTTLCRQSCIRQTHSTCTAAFRMESKLLLLAAVLVAVAHYTLPADAAFTCPKTAYPVPNQNTPACPAASKLTADITTQKTAADKLKTDLGKQKSQAQADQRSLQSALNLEKGKRQAAGTKVTGLMTKAAAVQTAAAAGVTAATGTQAAITNLKRKMQLLKQKVNALEAKALKKKPSPSTGTPSGGTPSGGTPSGGTPSGGTPSGGTPSGGTPSGGTPSGGTPSGGTPSGSATKPSHPQDCGYIHKQDPRKPSGLYSTKIPGETNFVITYCDMDIDGGGWTVIQRRKAPTPSFDRPWNDYKNGFGQPMDSFWWGLEKVYKVTKGQNFKLRIEMEDTQGLKKNAIYDNFRIDSELNKYKLTVGKYTGNAGNALMTHNGVKFSTNDQDNDDYPADSCAKAYKGGWWYNDHCFDANLNGYYSDKQPTGASGFWLPFNGYKGLKSSTMMIRHMNYNPPAAVAPIG
ncbi:PREDICTED: ficolin-1-like [Branchiostoma belcheri]|uniref:Ficolin-1-like n=1 Tax=Branchiostoma belcheri TaxID=7741 RepID=A0A6P4YKQ3_BRABE|nr:PREDICTED: ficolin-1-like [Branchiostoma belcheri]